MNQKQPEPAKVRVTEQETAEDKKDYMFLLEENLQLLRAVDKAKSTALEAATKTEKLQNELAVLQAKELNKKIHGYRLGRRFVLALHVILSIAVFASGFVLWIKNLAPPEACLTTIPGLLWFAIITSYISTLADMER